MKPILIAAALLCALPASAQAQLFRRPPPPPPPAETLPAPPPDPNQWWEVERERVDELFDPLGGRRAGRDAETVPVDNAVNATLYRLWGLQPLQTQLLRDDEVIMEVWVRPTRTTREVISRITLRRDGDVFVNARAGLACCRPEIWRRVDIDAKSTTWNATFFRQLAKNPAWEQPRYAAVERPDQLESVCIAGSGFDLTLIERGRARHLRRVCEQELIGGVAPLLTGILAPALGHDPRFDVVFPRGVSFAEEKAAYEAMLAAGGRLIPKTFNS